MATAARTWDDVEKAIKQAVADGILQDKRASMPRGVYQGLQVEWGNVNVDDVLGCVVHQNGSPNDDDPMATARYHTGQGNHIGKNGKPLASTCYSIMIPNLPGPAWLTGELFWRTWAQGAGEADHPGDENRHLKPILVMGGFEGPGYKRNYTKKGPTAEQVEKLTRVVKWLMAVFNFGGEGVYGHYHFGKAACPGFVLMDWVEDCRDKDDKAAFANVVEWQQALLRWNPACLPKFGPDGDWGGESKRALISFQRSQNIRVTGQRDPFVQLLLLQRFPAPVPSKTLEVTPDAEITFDVSDPVEADSVEPADVFTSAEATPAAAGAAASATADAEQPAKEKPARRAPAKRGKKKTKK